MRKNGSRKWFSVHTPLLPLLSFYTQLSSVLTIKVFWNVSQNLKENICVRVSSNKVAGRKLGTLSKEDYSTGVFL